MRFGDTAIPGVRLLEVERHSDERGHFARTFDREEFAAHGMSAALAQTSTSYNHRKGTLRGLHFQAAPRLEAKVVACLRGRIFDVAVDVREGSPAFGRWLGLELDFESGRILYLPEGVAHGFVTLSDDCLVSYQISEPYQPELARGVRFDDPVLDVRWPLVPAVVSARDRSLPLLDEAARAGLLPRFRP